MGASLYGNKNQLILLNNGFTSLTCLWHIIQFLWKIPFAIKAYDLAQKQNVAIKCGVQQG